MCEASFRMLPPPATASKSPHSPAPLLAKPILEAGVVVLNPHTINASHARAKQLTGTRQIPFYPAVKQWEWGHGVRNEPVQLPPWGLTGPCRLPRWELAV